VKFSIAVNMERYDPAQDMQAVARNALEMVQIAEQGGFEIAWAAEHHGVEMTVAPNPFQILLYWAGQTERIRLGTAVVVAPYWHPLRLAGEAALCDVLSDGRLELGIARGAFQYEFDRMAAGIRGESGVGYMKELLPAIRALWQGDYAHDGEHWSFPTATSVPKPQQQPHPPIWVAARDAGSMDWAFKVGAGLLTTPLQKPNSEIQVLADRFNETAANNPGVARPPFLMMRRTCVFDKPEDIRIPAAASIEYARRFENLFLNAGGVRNGFPQPVDAETINKRADYRVDTLSENLLFGTPEVAIEKLRLYKNAGVDVFCYNPVFGIDYSFSRRSLELFIERVMPAFP
jgi:flavin-dependent trigonelline monooxygenase, oxygenase component